MSYVGRLLKSNTIKRVLFAIFSQGFYAFLGIVISLILPIYMAPAEYGKWQIYFFYSAYLNFIGLGYNDGIQLKLAGREYAKLDFEKYRTNHLVITIYCILITVLLEVGAVLFHIDNRDMYFLLFLSILPTVFFNIFNAYFISTNRSVVYNMSNLFYKLVFCAGIAVAFFMKKNDSVSVVLIDVFSKVFLTIVLIVFGYKLVFGKISSVKQSIHDIYKICISGSVIMVTVLASGLLPVAGRIIIEHQESLEVYGIYSFGISLLSIILTFTSTIGIIIFPIIKRYSEDELINKYWQISVCYDVLLLGAFNFYLLGAQILTKAAPAYSSMLVYLPLLFAMCRVMGKLQLFIFPYYKYFGREKQYLFFNLTGVAVMMAGCTAGYYLGNVFGVALVSFLVMEIFYYAVEYYLYTRIWKVKYTVDLKSTIISCCFAVIGIGSRDKYFSFIYMAIYMIYLIVYFVQFRKNREG